MKKLLILLFVPTFVICYLSFVISPAGGYIPTKMHIQGLLTETADPTRALTGTYNFRIRLESPPYTFTKYYDLSGVSVVNGVFDLEFGDDDLRDFDFSRGNIKLDISIDGNYFYEGTYRVRQEVGSVPAALAAYNLKGGRVEAQGSPAVEARTPAAGHKVYLCSYSSTDNVTFGGLGLTSSLTRGFMAYYDNAADKYSGFRLPAMDISGNDIALYGFGKENGIHARGEVALKAENRSGGPALEVGPGRIRLPWSLNARTLGTFYHHQIDIAPIEPLGPASYSGAAGVVTFAHYTDRYGYDINQTDLTVTNSGQILPSSLIFLYPRAGNRTDYTNVPTAEAYITSKTTNSFHVVLKESLPLNHYAEFSFLIINRYVED